MTVYAPEISNQTEIGTEDLPTIINEINAAHMAAEQTSACALQYALKAGSALAKAKAVIPFGNWSTWLAVNFKGSERTARTYLRLAVVQDQHSLRQRAADLSIRDAVKLVTERKDKKPLADAIQLTRHIKKQIWATYERCPDGLKPVAIAKFRMLADELEKTGDLSW